MASTSDPTLAPRRRLHTGAEIPAVGMGTFGSDRFSAAEIANAVRDGGAFGYRHFDCASVYGNEPEIGEALNDLMADGVSREELWVTSKLWNDRHGEEDVIPACEQSLKDLNLDYLDLYLVHWPFPNYHAPGCDVDSRSPDAVPYLHQNYMKTWRRMEELVHRGLVRHIGASNVTVPKLKLLLRDAETRPACVEMELHPHFQQPELFQWCMERDLQPIGFCPIGSPTRPDRDKTDKDTVDTEDLVIKTAAERLGVHPAVICVKWAVQRGQVPIPFSIHPNEYRANLEAALVDPLSEEEMDAIAGIDRNCRLIKGQVFLWRDDQDWQDLWDVSGEITPP